MLGAGAALSASAPVPATEAQGLLRGSRRRGRPKRAKLRLLHVEREARGLGIGKRLVEECLRFARQAGYRKMTLWTQSILHAARHIYKQVGFQIVREEQHHSFGKDLTAETWELDLRTTG
jgi:GNAT superfamily N-acetyltransferase